MFLEGYMGLFYYLQLGNLILKFHKNHWLMNFIIY